MLLLVSDILGCCSVSVTFLPPEAIHAVHVSATRIPQVTLALLTLGWTRTITEGYNYFALRKHTQGQHLSLLGRAENETNPVRLIHRRRGMTQRKAITDGVSRRMLKRETASMFALRRMHYMKAQLLVCQYGLTKLRSSL